MPTLPSSIIKTTGAEFKAFVSDKAFWPEGSYYDDVVIHHNGKQMDGDTAPESVDPTDVLELHYGFLMLRGGGYEHLGDAFLRWREAEALQLVLVRVPKESVSRLGEVLASMGGEVV